MPAPSRSSPPLSHTHRRLHVPRHRQVHGHRHPRPACSRQGGLPGGRGEGGEGARVVVARGHGHHAQRRRQQGSSQRRARNGDHQEVEDEGAGGGDGGPPAQLLLGKPRKRGGRGRGRRIVDSGGGRGGAGLPRRLARGQLDAGRHRGGRKERGTQEITSQRNECKKRGCLSASRSVFLSLTLPAFGQRKKHKCGLKEWKCKKQGHTHTQRARSPQQKKRITFSSCPFSPCTPAWCCHPPTRAPPRQTAPSHTFSGTGRCGIHR